MQTKNKQLLIRVSETELAHITANAQEAGLTVSAYLREAGLNYAPESDDELHYSETDYQDALRKMRRVTH